MQVLHLLLVTNKSSNILEDLDILRTLAKIVPDYAHSLDEEGITKAAFDLLFAFDEVISLGYKENVTLQQVRQNTEMESHEEKLYKMIIQSKRQEAIQNMRQKAQEIDRAKMESAKAGRAGMPTSYTPSAGMGRSGMDLDNTPTYMSQSVSSGFGGSRPGPDNKPAKKGMQLGKAKKANDFLDSLRAEVQWFLSYYCKCNMGHAVCASTDLRMLHTHILHLELLQLHALLMLSSSEAKI